MSKFRLSGLVLLSFAIAGPVFAQSRPTLSSLVKAKLDPNDGKPQLIFMLQSYRMEKTEQPVRVTKTRTEQRVRTVTVDGKQVQVPYKVSVPYTEMVNEIAKPAGFKPKSFDASKFEIYDLEANSVSIEDASKRMEKLTTVFLMDNMRGQLRPIPDLQRSVLKPDSLIVLSRDAIRKRP